MCLFLLYHIHTKTVFITLIIPVFVVENDVLHYTGRHPAGGLTVFDVKNALYLVHYHTTKVHCPCCGWCSMTYTAEEVYEQQG